MGRLAKRQRGSHRWRLLCSLSGPPSERALRRRRARRVPRSPSCGRSPRLTPARAVGCEPRRAPRVVCRSGRAGCRTARRECGTQCEPGRVAPRPSGPSLTPSESSPAACMATQGRMQGPRAAQRPGTDALPRGRGAPLARYRPAPPSSSGTRLRLGSRESAREAGSRLRG